MDNDGYGKIFKQIYASTLRADWKALVTFEQFIVLCDPRGVLDMPPEAISAFTGIPLDIISHGIKVLEEHDPRSRSPQENGRRIVRLDQHRDWGWQIVNHKFYRDLASKDEKREADRKRIADKRASSEKSSENKDVADCRGESQDVASCRGESPMSPTQTQTQTQTQENISSLREEGDSKLPPCPHEKIISLYHELLPELPRVREWNKTRRGYLQARWKEHPGIDYWTKLLKYVSRSDFLMGRVNGRDGKPPFIASLAWIVKPNNFAKIVEGNYNRGAKQ